MDNEFPIGPDTLKFMQLLAEEQQNNDPVPQGPQEQKHLSPWSLAVLLGGQLGDLGSTYYGWTKGDQEQNPLLTHGGPGSPNYNPHPALNVALAKGAGIGSGMLIGKLLERAGHEKAGDLARFIMGARGLYDTQNNLRRPWADGK